MFERCFLAERYYDDFGGGGYMGVLYGEDYFLDCLVQFLVSILSVLISVEGGQSLWWFSVTMYTRPCFFKRHSLKQWHVRNCPVRRYCFWYIHILIYVSVSG